MTVKMSRSTSQPSTSAKSARPIHPVIEIVNGYKHFGISKKWHQVMRNVNLLAYSGQTYVLLGPHGSGKTTILNVILGLYTLKQGFVKIFGFTPGDKLSGCPGHRVGYGPQSNGLFQQMTINETFRYYGKMLKLKSGYINERISYLSDFLALPTGKSFIGHCSEAEKRQISFAVSVLHEPELLLLDEPCRGVDPVFRNSWRHLLVSFVAPIKLFIHSMWEYLHLLVCKGSTVFLTTQDLPEANKADRVGILRNGYLLMEGNPSELISDYKEKSLESLYTNIYSLKIRKNMVSEKKSISDHPRVRFERLTTSGSEGFIYVEEEDDKIQKKNQFESKKKIKCTYLKRYLKILPNIKRLGMVLFRDVLISFRSYVWLMSVFLIPIILVVIFSYTVGQTPTKLKTGVVNFEATEEECRKHSEKYSSCQVLKHIDKNVLKLVHYEKYKEAEEDALKMKVSALLIIGEKFTNQLLRSMTDIVFNNLNKLGIPKTAQLVLRLDMTSKIVATTIQNSVKQAVEKYLQGATKFSKIKNATIGYPMHVGIPFFGTEKSTDTEFICTGLTVVFLYHLASFLASVTMVSHRVGNLAARDYVAGVRIIESVLSQMTVYGTLLLTQAGLMYTVLMSIRNMPMKGSLPYLALVILVQIWCGLCFGFLVANLTKTAVQAGYVVFCFLCASLILCGVLWPLNGQPDWLLTLVKFLPQTQAICAVRCIIQRGISINNEEVYLGIIIPLVWLVLFILVTYLLTK